MKKTKLIALGVALAGLASTAYAIDIKGLLGGNAGETIGNIIEGVFTKSNLEVKDLAGTWQSTGAAVTFKSDNFLQKAGGIAGAAAIESKLNPYFERYGLVGAELAIAEDGSMTMKIKKMTLKGTVSKGEEEGTFKFDFKAFGAVKITSLTAYVEKSPTSLNVMFDANKLKSFISVVANISGMQLAKTAASILDSYDGACIGFKMKSIGGAPASTGVESTSDSSSDGIGSLLKGVLGGGSKSSSEPEKTEPQQNEETESQTSKGVELLKGILGGSKK